MPPTEAEAMATFTCVSLSAVKQKRNRKNVYFFWAASANVLSYIFYGYGLHPPCDVLVAADASVCIRALFHS